MKDYNISENFILPSKGKIYTENINPDVTLRSMTTADEMKRLSPSEFPYKKMSTIIDDCIIEDLPLSAYDMCIGDYQFLLYKLRIVTYGADYKITSRCPYCNFETEETLNLDELEINYLDDDLNFDEYSEVILPVSKAHIKLKIQTPRMLDAVTQEVKEFKQKTKNKTDDPSILYMLCKIIDTVDGQKLDRIQLEEFIKKMPMKDTAEIFSKAEKLNESIGINLDIEHVCDICGLTYKSPFRVQQDFFRPT